MEDYIIREIDRIGEMLLHVARRLGLFKSDSPNYGLAEVKQEFDRESLPFDMDTVLKQRNPVLYLAEEKGLSDAGLETFIEIIFHSDLDEAVKKALLADAIAYLDRKGNYSFRLHSLLGE